MEEAVDQGVKELVIDENYPGIVHAYPSHLYTLDTPIDHKGDVYINVMLATSKSVKATENIVCKYLFSELDIISGGSIRTIGGITSRGKIDATSIEATTETLEDVAIQCRELTVKGAVTTSGIVKVEIDVLIVGGLRCRRLEAKNASVGNAIAADGILVDGRFFSERHAIAAVMLVGNSIEVGGHIETGRHFMARDESVKDTSSPSLTCRKGDIVAGDWISAAGSLIAGRDVKSGSDIWAGNKITCGRTLHAGKGVFAGESIVCGTLDVGQNVYTGTVTWRDPEPKDGLIRCLEYKNGQIVLGHLIVGELEDGEEALALV